MLAQQLELQINFLKRIVMNKCFLFFLLSFNFAFCQIEKDISKDINAEYEAIKTLRERINKNDLVEKYSKTDTLFIVFKKSKNVKKKKYQENKKFKDSTISYNFVIKDSSFFTFIYRKYIDFDKRESDSSSLILIKDRKFLKENKDRVLTKKFFRKDKKIKTDYFMQILHEIMSSKKIIFIIDKDEFFDDKILLRQVNI